IMVVMLRPQDWLDRVARRIGGPRVLALALLRALAVLADLAWALLAPTDYHVREPIRGVRLAFLVSSAALMAALWRWPARTLGLNLLIVAEDLVFTLLLIQFTGGAREHEGTVHVQSRPGEGTTFIRQFQP